MDVEYRDVSIRRAGDNASTIRTRQARSPSLTTFDAPGAGTASGQGTFANDINPEGAITGYYLDASGVFHGFLRAKHGTFTTFDAPGAGTGFGYGTIGFGVNPAGAVTGYDVDVRGVFHGFLRASEGTITTFDAPGAGTGFFPGHLLGQHQPGGGDGRMVH